jgi:hypothetical protein
MADLAIIEGLFVSVFEAPYDFDDAQGRRVVGSKHTLNVLLETGEVVHVDVRPSEVGHVRGFKPAQKITLEAEYRAKVRSEFDRAEVVKALRRVTTGADANGEKARA